MSMRILMLALVVAVTTSGCLYRRTISKFDEHPSRNISVVETTDLFFTGSVTRQFWTCRDQGETLVCSKTCGGATGYECHTVNYWGSNLQ